MPLCRILAESFIIFFYICHVPCIFQGCYDALKETLMAYWSPVIAIVCTPITLEVLLFC